MNKKIALGFCVCIVLIVIAIILFFKPTSEYNLIQDIFGKNRPIYEYNFGDTVQEWLNPFDFSNIPGTSPNSLMLALYDNKADSKGFNFNDIYINPLKNGLGKAEKSIWDTITNKIFDVTTKDMTTKDASANVYFVKKRTVVDSSLNSLISEGVKTMARTFLVPGYKYTISHDNIGLGRLGGTPHRLETRMRAMSLPPISFVFTRV